MNGSNGKSSSKHEVSLPFQWWDGNGGEDRSGYLVTLEGECIRKATSKDAYVLGATAGESSVIKIGSVSIQEDGRCQIIGFCQSEVVLCGKAAVRDDGTCQPNGTCRPNDEGIATLHPFGYRVLKRLDERTILIMVK